MHSPRVKWLKQFEIKKNELPRWHWMKICKITPWIWSMSWIHNKLQVTKLSNASPYTYNLLSFLWCPILVGPCNVSHNRLGNPNCPYASIRWLDHLSSISTHLVLPKLSKVILNSFWVRQITIWAILAHMTFYSTSVANSVLNLDEGALDLILVLLSITNLLEWKSGLYGLLDGSCSSPGLDRSDRSGVTGLVRPELLRTALGHIPLFPASKAHSIF